MSAATVQTIKTQTLARIEEITAAPKPSYSANGVSYSHTEYLAELKRTVDWCDLQLAKEDIVEIEQIGFGYG